jgi:hypothetical protein
MHQHTFIIDANTYKKTYTYQYFCIPYIAHTSYIKMHTTYAFLAIHICMYVYVSQWYRVHVYVLYVFFATKSARRAICTQYIQKHLQYIQNTYRYMKIQQNLSVRKLLIACISIYEHISFFNPYVHACVCVVCRVCMCLYVYIYECICAQYTCAYALLSADLRGVHVCSCQTPAAPHGRRCPWERRCPCGATCYGESWRNLPLGAGAG